MTKRIYQSVSEQNFALYGESTGISEEPLLSPQRAFVVQFREGMDATPARFSGRVEHLVSGHATRFHSPEELLAFLATVLSNIQDGKGGVSMKK